jgi:hypothetical protein
MAGRLMVAGPLPKEGIPREAASLGRGPAQADWFSFAKARVYAVGLPSTPQIAGPTDAKKEKTEP